ncbi:Com family DNA-binding transcriptional regulator [Acinetobacter rathckeae]|uniref:Com family DNA-binding transcriptional regulator n=1 Tax=Acinetobacter rathckeae TaxID=2605272 RepID=UPI0018A29FBC|nr:Com family DNA-binding transcriptional regulator [Acinetobacter rathckeae]MBF7688049.1 Com family DNA-binding transcriptional regulator [Acinetobacter rathckeae]
MTNIKCRCCFKLLAKIRHFDVIEIKCTRCKTLNTFQRTASTLPECQEHQHCSGNIHDTKPLTTIQS